MPASTFNLMVGGDHAVPVEPLGGTATVAVIAGGPVFYADNPQVSATGNQGSIVAGSSLSFANQAWIIASALATVTVTQANSVPSAVTADAGVPDGVSDNTAYLQARISAAASLGVSLRIPPATWVISKLQLPSNTTVDATGATFVQANGVNTRMILNSSLTQGTPGTTRDTNISWTGGKFLKGAGQQNVGNTGSLATGLDDHCTMFGFVDGLTFRNVTITQTGTGGNAGTGGRYGCYVWNCTQFIFENYTAVSVSASVNQSTLQLIYCQNGHIKGVYGSDGDDAVALVNGNLAGDNLTNGPSHMEGITIEDVYGSAPSNGVRIMSGSTAGSAPFYNVQRIRVNNVRINSGSRGIAGAVFIGGDHGGTYPNLQNGFIQDVVVENVTQLRASTPAVYIQDFAEVHGVTLRGINNQQDSACITIPNNNAGHFSIKVADCEWTTAITAGSYFPISVATTVVRTLELENCRINAAATGSAVVGPIDGSGGPGWLVANNCRCTGKAYVLGRFTNTTRIAARGLEQEDANGLGWFQTNTGAVVTVFEWSAMTLAGNNGITQTAGSVAIGGPGAVQFPGASGSQALTAGAATVNTGTGLASATSLIRSHNLTAANACGVTSRGTNTFNLGGTGTDTILWEIIKS